jgi:hypothetical protein
MSRNASHSAKDREQHTPSPSERNCEMDNEEEHVEMLTRLNQV